MNWSRGLFRAWTVASILWVLAMGVLAVVAANQKMIRHHDPTEAEVSVCQLRGPANVFDCFDQIRTVEAPGFSSGIVSGAIVMAIAVPLLVLGAGFVGRWIIRGFRA